MNADDLAWQPAMTATEVRMEAADKAGGRHWDWDGDCWCGRRHRAVSFGLVLVDPPWCPSRRSAEAGSAVAR
jgi:hypothetical protein